LSTQCWITKGVNVWENALNEISIIKLNNNFFMLFLV